MKIQLILKEAKFSKPEYAYHTTKIDNLKSILKQGLVPNFKIDGYGSEEVSVAGYSLASLKGVYFTRNPNDALYIGKGLPGMAVVIVAKVQPKQAELDEDRMINSIFQEHTFIEQLRGMFGPEDNFEMYEKTSKFKRLIDTHVAAALGRTDIDDRGKHTAANYVRNYLVNLARFYYSDRTDERELKSSQNAVTKTLRLLAHKHKKVHHSFKIDAPVGFSGANRIVGIYDMTDNISWGDVGELSGYTYHTVNTPMDILSRHARYM